jgi:hypothetical protein
VQRRLHGRSNGAVGRHAVDCPSHRHGDDSEPDAQQHTECKIHIPSAHSLSALTARDERDRSARSL